MAPSTSLSLCLLCQRRELFLFDFLVVQHCLRARSDICLLNGSPLSLFFSPSTLDKLNNPRNIWCSSAQWIGERVQLFSSGSSTPITANYKTFNHERTGVTREAGFLLTPFLLLLFG